MTVGLNYYGPRAHLLSIEAIFLMYESISSLLSAFKTGVNIHPNLELPPLCIGYIATNFGIIHPRYGAGAISIALLEFGANHPLGNRLVLEVFFVASSRGEFTSLFVLTANNIEEMLSLHSSLESYLSRLVVSKKNVE